MLQQRQEWEGAGRTRASALPGFTVPHSPAAPHQGQWGGAQGMVQTRTALRDSPHS